MPFDPGRFTAARIAIIYALGGLLWIVGSDWALATLGWSRWGTAQAQTAKGSAFVLGSAALVYVLLCLELARRARGEAALETSHRRYQAFVEGSIQGLAVQRDFVVLFANEAFAHIFGYESAEAMRDAHMRPLIDPEELPRCESYYRARMAGEPAPTRYEFRARRRDGTPIWVSNLVTVITWEGLPAVFVTMVDVTQVKTAQEEIRRQQEAREAAEHLAVLGRLAAGVAHELRNPLSVVLGRVQLLKTDLASGAPPSPETVARQLPGLEEAVSRMQRIVDGLSNYARPALEPVPVAVAEVVANVRDLVAYQARRAGLTLVTEVDEHVPAVRGHRSQLVQILLNLATNAIEAMAPQRQGALTFRARVQDGRVVVEVADTGPGGPPGAFERVWEPFYTTKAEGTGLGLSIVRSLVAAQPDAEIGVESGTGLGATFRLTMPALR